MEHRGDTGYQTEGKAPRLLPAIQCGWPCCRGHAGHTGETGKAVPAPRREAETTTRGCRSSSILPCSEAVLPHSRDRPVVSASILLPQMAAAPPSNGHTTAPAGTPPKKSRSLPSLPWLPVRNRSGRCRRAHTRLPRGSAHTPMAVRQGNGYTCHTRPRVRAY